MEAVCRNFGPMEEINKISSKLQEIPDFRRLRGRRYNLHNLLTISILAIVSGADDFEAMASFANKKAVFLTENGLLDGHREPSHDIFRWIFMHFDGPAFSILLGAWLEHSVEKTLLPDATQGYLPKRIHLDGKSLRATRTQEHTRSALICLS